MIRSVSVRVARLSMSHLLLAVLVLVARLLGPAVPPAQAGNLAASVGQLVICHAGDGPSLPNQDPGKPADHEHDCLLCPACHLPVSAVLPAPVAPLAWAPAGAIAKRPASPPPSTVPPRPARLADRPTGPPIASI